MPMKARTTIAGSISIKRSLALPFANVATQKLVNAPHKLVKEHLRELVFFERRVKQQTLKLRIVFVMFERAESERFKHSAVVFALDARRQPSLPGSNLPPEQLCDREWRHRVLLWWQSAGRPSPPKRRPPGQFLWWWCRENPFRKKTYSHREDL